MPIDNNYMTIVKDRESGTAIFSNLTRQKLLYFYFLVSCMSLNYKNMPSPPRVFRPGILAVLDIPPWTETFPSRIDIGIFFLPEGIRSF